MRNTCATLEQEAQKTHVQNHQHTNPQEFHSFKASPSQSRAKLFSRSAKGDQTRAHLCPKGHHGLPDLRQEQDHHPSCSTFSRLCIPDPQACHCSAGCFFFFFPPTREKVPITTHLWQHPTAVSARWQEGPHPTAAPHLQLLPCHILCQGSSPRAPSSSAGARPWHVFARAGFQSLTFIYTLWGNFCFKEELCFFFFFICLAVVFKC